ncbi:hypothetical protein DIPPA_32856 [Diplonema papillatum]|nr:hypothetical protein DIPPA_32856 [Diplonema papillatum]
MLHVFCVQDGIEAWCLENGERQTREHALRARGTLGIQQQDAGNRLRRTKSLRSAGSMYKVLDARQTRAFEAWAVLDEWRVELLAVVEALDDLSLARNVGRGPQRKPQSALVRKPSLPPSILATPPPSVKRVPSTV